MGAVRVRLVIVFTALLGLVGVVPSGASAVAVLTIEGRGWGHGVGLSQAGARWMGVDGATTAQILQHFYPGTSIGTGSGAVRVAVHSVPAATVLAFPNGGEVRGTGKGFPVAVQPGGQVRIAFEAGAYRVDRMITAQSRGEPVTWAQVPALPSVPTTSTTAPGSTTTTKALLPPVAPPSTTATTRPPSSTTSSSRPSSTTTSTGQPPPTVVTEPGSGVRSSTPVVAVPPMAGVVAVPERGRQYRGVIHATASAGPLRLVNELDVEQYLRGMGEVRDPSWPQSALGAQAVVARTYALRAMTVGGELCDYDLCQVYLGQQVEYAAMDRAVAATRGQVLGFGGRLATAVYSANGGGVSATTLEGFGTPDGRYPYLRSVQYQTRTPFPWTVDVGLADLGRRFGYRGGVTSVEVAERGPSGRALQVVMDGDGGPLAVSGLQFARKLGLRSTLFDVRIGEAEEAPPPPPELDLIQALPDDGSALESAALETEDSIKAETRQRRRQRAAPPVVPEDGGSSSSETAAATIAAAALALAILGSLRGFGVIRPGLAQRTWRRVRRT